MITSCRIVRNLIEDKLLLLLHTNIHKTSMNIKQKKVEAIDARTTKIWARFWLGATDDWALSDTRRWFLYGRCHLIRFHCLRSCLKDVIKAVWTDGAPFSCSCYKLVALVNQSPRTRDSKSKSHDITAALNAF